MSISILLFLRSVNRHTRTSGTAGYASVSQKRKQNRTEQTKTTNPLPKLLCVYLQVDGQQDGRVKCKLEEQIKQPPSSFLFENG